MTIIVQVVLVFLLVISFLPRGLILFEGPSSTVNLKQTWWVVMMEKESAYLTNRGVLTVAVTTAVLYGLEIVGIDFIKLQDRAALLSVIVLVLMVLYKTIVGGRFCWQHMKEFNRMP